MGTDMTMLGSEFRIPKDEKREAFEEVKELIENNELTYVEPGHTKDCHYLKEIMSAARFPIELDEDLNVVGIDFIGEKSGVKKLFEAIIYTKNIVSKMPIFSLVKEV